VLSYVGSLTIYDRRVARQCSLHQYRSQHTAPRRGFVVEVEGCKQVLVGSNEMGLDAVVVGVLAVRALVLGVAGLELGGGSGDLCRAAGERRDAGIEGLQVGLQGIRGVPFRVDGHKQHLEASRLGPKTIEHVGPVEQGRWADVRAVGVAEHHGKRLALEVGRRQVAAVLAGQGIKGLERDRRLRLLGLDIDVGDEIGGIAGMDLQVGHAYAGKFGRQGQRDRILAGAHFDRVHEKFADPGAAAAQGEAIEVGADVVAAADRVAAGAQLGEHRRAGLPALHHISGFIVDGLDRAFRQSCLARHVLGRGTPVRIHGFDRADEVVEVPQGIFALPFPA
jgi:hypothetical protein